MPDATSTPVSEEVMLAKLSEYDFILALDASGSMSTEDMPNSKSRWGYMRETVENFARYIGKVDTDGLGLVTFGGSRVESTDGVTADKVADVFRKLSPGGSTPLAEALTASLKLAGKSDKKDFIIVFTDGEPDDQAKAAQVIIDASQKQSTDDALTILFVQVGRDAGASKYLRMLDDGLAGAKFDIVDAKTIDEVEQFPSIAALVFHAISD